MKKIILIVLMLLFVPIMAISANGIPYLTYTYSSTNRRFVYTQDAYLPLSRIQNLEDIEMQDPQDITIDNNDILYIADRGLGFVIKYDLELQQKTIIGEGVLSSPTGVHVAEDGRVYVTDFELKKAFQFEMNDNEVYELKVTYQEPVNSPFFGEDTSFDPTKVVTDKADNVYVLLAGNVNGLAQFKNDGSFFGYFGGNKIPPTWQNTVTYLLFDENTRRDLFQIIPDPVYNLAIDQDGLILTTTKGQEGYLKLNIANFVYNSSVWGFDNVEDLFVGPYETIFTISSNGYIVEYAPDGSVLFIFSGTDSSGVQGLFQNPTGIAVDSKNNLYVIDDKTKSLQLFTPTSFANLIHYAIELYQNGRYKESLEPWQQVLEKNALFDLANQGLGDAYFAVQNYREALYYYEIARDVQGYSDAFWEVRNDILLESGSSVIIFIGIVFLFTLVSRYLKISEKILKPIKTIKSKIMKLKFAKDIVYPFYILRHPIDGHYGIKRESKGSITSANLYYFLFFIFYMFFIYETNFLFNPIISSQINIVEEIVKVFVPLLLFVSANYLVCSIRDGEGRFKDVYLATSYSLLPAIIGLPIITIVSQVLTLNEGFIFDAMYAITLFFTGFYMLFMIKEIHYYDLKNTIGNFLITLFTGLMIVVVIFIIYLLLGEIVTLILDIIREVNVRA